MSAMNQFFTNAELAEADQLAALPNVIHIEMYEHATYELSETDSLEVTEHFAYGLPSFELESLEALQALEEEKEARFEMGKRQISHRADRWK